MSGRGMKTLWMAATLLIPAAAGAQSQVQLSAATAVGASGRTEVRLRVRPMNGWLPADGVRIYRIVGSNPKVLVSQSKPSDATVDRMVPSLKGKALWSSAARTMATNRALDFRAIRPPSTAARFRDLKTANETILSLRERPESDPQRSAQIAQTLNRIGTLRAQALPRLSIQTLRPGLSGAVPTLSAADRDIFAARGRLALAALVKSTVAESLGLGATDRGVRSGDRVRYVVVAMRGSADGAGLDTTEITVGGETAPPAPTGLDAQQDVDDNGEPTGTVALRWDRLDAAVEERLLNASYRIERREAPAPTSAIRTGIGTLPGTKVALSTTDTTWQKVNAKPVVIAAIDGTEEPVSFYDDDLDEPGTYEYRIVLVDGFDRTSPWSEPERIRIVEWRHPANPIRPEATLDSEIRDAGAKSAVAPVPTKGVLGLRRQAPAIPRDLRSWSAGILAGGKASVSVSWSPVDAPRGLTVKYRVWRLDVEDSTAVPVLITPQPIAGEDMPPTPDQAAATTSAQTLSRQIQAGSLLPAVKRAQKSLLEQLRTAALPRIGTADTGVPMDHKYVYLVRAVYVESGFESKDVPSGKLSVPSPARPPTVQGFSYAGFTPSQLLPASQMLADTVGTSRPRAFSIARAGLARPAPAIGAYRSAGPATTGGFIASSRLKSGVKLDPSKMVAGGAAGGAALTTTTSPTAGAPVVMPDLARGPILPRVPVFARADLSKLRMNFLRSRDDGGIVTLRWNAVPRLRDVCYKIQRRYSNLPFADVGTTVANRTEFRDVMPRSAARTYVYRVIAITRWGVEGAASAEIQAPVPSTVQPSRPNLMAVAPDTGDRAIRVRVDPNPAEESVIRYRILRDNAEVGVLNGGGPDSVELAFVDRGLAANQTYVYKVVAETGIGLKSPASPTLSARAVKTVATAPASVQGTSDDKGVKVTWAATPDAASYCVQRRTSPTAPPQVLAGRLTVLQFLDVTAMAGVAYTYEVTATDAFGNVSPPARVSVTP